MSGSGFSALQRAEIAEMLYAGLFFGKELSFSALQRAEIAEILFVRRNVNFGREFQCSSTSRNC